MHSGRRTTTLNTIEGQAWTFTSSSRISLDPGWHWWFWPAVGRIRRGMGQWRSGFHKQWTGHESSTTLPFLLLRVYLELGSRRIMDVMRYGASCAQWRADGENYYDRRDIILLLLSLGINTTQMYEIYYRTNNCHPLVGGKSVGISHPSPTGREGCGGRGKMRSRRVNTMSTSQWPSPHLHWLQNWILTTPRVSSVRLQIYPFMVTMRS